jgi:hypothetical protein
MASCWLAVNDGDVRWDGPNDAHVLCLECEPSAAG